MIRFRTAAFITLLLSAESATAQRGGGPLWSRLDADRDGILSSTELESAPRAVRRFDANRDGQIDSKEFRSAMRQRSRQTALRADMARRGDDRRGRGGAPGTSRSNAIQRTGLQIGAPMPNVEVFDSEGNPFRFGQLEGQHAVIVFGCLT